MKYKKVKIDKLGFEIEGEFAPEVITFLRKIQGGVIKGDGSISNCRHNGLTCRASNLTCAEFNSPVYDVDNYALTSIGMKRIDRFFQKLNTHYEQNRFHFNKTMGFHIHLSFTPKVPAEIVSMQFMNYFKKELAKAFPEQYQARATCYYAGVRVTERELLNKNCHERFRFVNVWPAINKHGTIEVRFFGTDTPLKMLEFIHFTQFHFKQFIKKGVTIKPKVRIPELAPVEQSIERIVEKTKPVLIEY